MKFLADMAISQSTITWLRDQGYDAVHVRDETMQRAEDAVILAHTLYTVEDTADHQRQPHVSFLDVFQHPGGIFLVVEHGVHCRHVVLLYIAQNKADL